MSVVLGAAAAGRSERPVAAAVSILLVGLAVTAALTAGLHWVNRYNGREC